MVTETETEKVESLSVKLGYFSEVEVTGTSTRLLEYLFQLLCATKLNQRLLDEGHKQ
jgi:hypothetical protein